VKTKISTLKFKAETKILNFNTKINYASKQSGDVTSLSLTPESVKKAEKIVAAKHTTIHKCFQPCFRHAPALETIPKSIRPPVLWHWRRYRRRNCFRFVEVDVRATDRNMNCRMWMARRGTNYAIKREA